MKYTIKELNFCVGMAVMFSYDNPKFGSSHLGGFREGIIKRVHADHTYPIQILQPNDGMHLMKIDEVKEIPVYDQLRDKKLIKLIMDR